MCRIKTILISAITISIMAVWPVHASEILETINLPEYQPYTIFSCLQQDEYWILERGNGWICLEETSPNVWQHTFYSIGPVFNTSCMDSNGYFYCTGHDDAIGCLIWVFDTNTRSVIQTIRLTTEHWYFEGITLSPDEQYAYCVGWTWPGEEQFYSYSDSDEHPDSGVVMEVDLQTGLVTDQGITSALPITIYYEENSLLNDRLYISTSEYQLIQGEETFAQTLTAKTDVIDLQRGLPRIDQINTSHTLIPFTNDIIDWSDTEPLIAICCPNTTPYTSDPDYTHGMLIVNTETNQVVDRFGFYDDAGNSIGVMHALISEYFPGRVYITLGNGSYTWNTGLLAIDYDTGAVIESIPTSNNYMIDFIHELPDGRLILTAGRAGKILIVDPT